jgi:hypothetical protein
MGAKADGRKAKLEAWAKEGLISSSDKDMLLGAYAGKG